MRKPIHINTKLGSLVSIFVLLTCVFSLTLADLSTHRNSALTAVDNPEETTQNSDGVSIDTEPDSSGQTYERFEPTNEWQTVHKGQAIPPGLHVRLNLQTGLKEAKLMDGEGDGKDGLSYWKKADKEGMVNKKGKSFTRNELKHAMKKFKEHKTFEEQEAKSDESHESHQPDKKSYKSYDELKEDFTKLNAAIQTEGEVVTELFDQLKENSDKAALRKILAELEFSLHKIDNALLFMDLGGMSEFVKLLNSTDPDLRHDTAFVLGSAMQSNPKVQIKAMEAGILQRLITILSTDMSMIVRKKALYAVSALIRHFPYAQKRFLALGGLSVFSQLFTQPYTEKMRIQVITLLTDLNREKRDSWLNFQHGDTQQKEKLRQYNEIDILEMMVETGWCEKVTSLLELQDYDTQEKVLATMNEFAAVCRPSFKLIAPQLKRLETKYDNLCEEDKNANNSDDDVDEFFCTLSQSVSLILLKLENVKEEL